MELAVSNGTAVEFLQELLCDRDAAAMFFENRIACTSTRSERWREPLACHAAQAAVGGLGPYSIDDNRIEISPTESLILAQNERWRRA